MALELSIGGNLTALPAFVGKIRKQVPFAAMRALADTVKAAQRDYRAALPTVFDRPTPFTLGSSVTRFAKKTDLKAALVIKDYAARSLAAEILGGGRAEKPFERALAGGITGAGDFAVPGQGATLNTYGNLSRTEIARILRGIAGGSRVIAGPRSSRRKAARAGNKPAVGDYFVGGVRGGSGLAVYRLVAPGRVAPVLVFARKTPSYRKRLDFFGIVEKSASHNFMEFFRKRLVDAVATAR